MCGRFSNALPAPRYTATVRHQLGRDQRPERSSDATSQQPPPKEKTADTSKTDNADDDDSLDLQTSLAEDDYHPTHNVSPSSQVPVVHLAQPVPLPHDDHLDEHKSIASQNLLTIQCMRWGLLPSHTTSIPRGPDAIRTINARDDSVLSGTSMWTPLLRKGKRCVVFVQGFYEWQKKPDGSKVAHFVGMTQEGQGRMDVNGVERALMPMAGLYEKCTIDGQDVLSFTIITTDSNEQLSFLHDRMPVILPSSKAIMTWLGSTVASAKQVCSLLKPYNAGKLDVYPVPREVGKVGNDNGSFILPVSARKDGIAAAFGRASSTTTATTTKHAEADANTETHAPLDEELQAVEGGSSSPGKKRKAPSISDEEMAQALQQEEDGKAKKVKSETNTESDADMAKRLQSEEEDNVKKNAESSHSITDVESIDAEDSKHSDDRKDEGVEDIINDDKTTFVPEDRQGPAPSSKFSPEPYNPPVSPDRPHGGYSTSGRPSGSYPFPRGHPAHNTSPATSPKKFEKAAKGTKDIRNFFGGG